MSSMSVSKDLNLIFVFLIQAKGIRSYSLCKENLRTEEKDFSFVMLLSVKLQKFLPIPVFTYSLYVLA